MDGYFSLSMQYFSKLLKSRTGISHSFLHGLNNFNSIPYYCSFFSSDSKGLAFLRCMIYSFFVRRLKKKNLFSVTFFHHCPVVHVNSKPAAHIDSCFPYALAYLDKHQLPSGQHTDPNLGDPYLQLLPIP